MTDLGAATRSLLAQLGRGTSSESGDRPTQVGSTAPPAVAASTVPPALTQPASSGAGPQVLVEAASQAAGAPPGTPAAPSGTLVYGRALLAGHGATVMDGVQAQHAVTVGAGPPTSRTTLSGGLVGSPETVFDTARLGLPSGRTESAPPGSSVWQRLWSALAGVMGQGSRPALAEALPLLSVEWVARAAIPELAPGQVAAAEAAVGTSLPLVRPTLATAAFAGRARLAWERATTEPDSELRRVHLTEARAWAERATRAARSLQRVLPPPTDDDRAWRALLRTALGALREGDPGSVRSAQAMSELEEAARSIGRHLGIPLPDRLGSSGRHDVPGLWARFTDQAGKPLIGLLVITLPVIAFGLLILAFAG